MATSSCLIYDDFSTWDLRELSKDCASALPYYGQDDASGHQHLAFNPCNYVDFDKSEYYDDVVTAGMDKTQSFAFLVDSHDPNNLNWYPLTVDGNIIPDSVEAIYVTTEARNTPMGIKYTYNSDTVCPYNTEGTEATNFVFSNTVMCTEDAALSGQGNGVINSVQGMCAYGT